MLYHVHRYLVLEVVDVKRYLRARADKAHIAFQHVYELRKLVYREFPYERAEFRAAGVGVRAPGGVADGAVAHGFQLIHRKDFLVKPYALLPEYHIPAHGDLYYQHADQYHRRGQYQQHQRTDDIQGALERGVSHIVQRNAPYVHQRDISHHVYSRGGAHVLVYARDNRDLRAGQLACLYYV